METQIVFAALALLWLVGLVIKSIWYSQYRRSSFSSYFYSFFRWYSRPHFISSTSHSRKRFMKFSNMYNLYTGIFILLILLMFATKHI